MIATLCKVCIFRGLRAEPAGRFHYVCQRKPPAIASTRWPRVNNPDEEGSQLDGDGQEHKSTCLYGTRNDKNEFVLCTCWIGGE